MNNEMYQLKDFPELLKVAREAAVKRPELKEEIADCVYMARDEANDGGSRNHEEELAICSIKELLED